MINKIRKINKKREMDRIIWKVESLFESRKRIINLLGYFRKIFNFLFKQW